MKGKEARDAIRAAQAKANREARQRVLRPWAHRSAYAGITGIRIPPPDMRIPAERDDAGHAGEESPAGRWEVPVVSVADPEGRPDRPRR